MNAHIAHFAVYLSAMVGVFSIMLFIAHKCMLSGITKRKSENLKILDKLDLSPRKSLYIIQAGEKKILIASDNDRTSFLTELKENEEISYLKNVHSNENKEINKNISFTTNIYQENEPLLKSILTKIRG